MVESLGGPDATAAPNEGVLIAELIQMLSQRPRNSLLLSDLTALMPGPLRQRVKEIGGLTSWINRFPSLFQIVGAPGKELVVLVVGNPAAAQQAQQAQEAELQGEQENEMPRLRPHAAPSVTEAEVAAGGGYTAEPEMSRSPYAVFDEEVDGECAVQLRGLPYKATVEDIMQFLGEHTAHLAQEDAVYLVLNRDGRPSGFARVLFTSSEAAKRCRDEMHLRSMDDRYVEVFLFSERPSKGKKQRGEELVAVPGPDGVARNLFAAEAAAGVTKEQVVRECRAEMADPSKRKLLLSMLGVALSAGSRAYLKQIDQGLKNFLVQYPNEFSVEGGKGCEYVSYMPLNEAGDAGSYKASSATSAPRSSISNLTAAEAIIPASPKSKMPEMAHSASRVPATPSNWGTPHPWEFMPPFPQGSMLGGGGDAGAGAGNPIGWPPAPAWGMGPMQQIPPYWAPGPDPRTGGYNEMAMLFAAEASANMAAAAVARTANGFGAVPDQGGVIPPVFSTLAGCSASGTNTSAKPFMPAAPLSPSNDGPTGGGSPTGSASAVRLRGLPFVSTEQDILAFFAQHDIVDRVIEGPNAVQLLLRSNGRPSGQAVVQMRDAADAELAQRVLSGQWMGSRYIEVFLQGSEPDSTSPTAPAAGAPPKTLSLACGLSGGPLTAPAASSASAAAGMVSAAPGQAFPTMGWPGPMAAMTPWSMPHMHGMPGAGYELSAGTQGAPDPVNGHGTWENLFNFLGSENAALAGAAAGTGPAK